PVAPEVDGELLFSTPAYTYDLDNGVYLGYGTQLPLRISAYTFRAFARLPYRVDGLQVVVRDSPRLGDTVTVDVVLTVAGGPAHGHRLRLDVLDSSGRPLRYLARELAAECGAATFTVPTALNDPAGVWTIVVTDVTTGTRGRVAVDLGPRTPSVRAPEPLQVEAVDD